jgi:ABC-type molybdate transport system substrate-binding protein
MLLLLLLLLVVVLFLLVLAGVSRASEGHVTVTAAGSTPMLPNSV